jgi:hypothetical protein
MIELRGTTCAGAFLLDQYASLRTLIWHDSKMRKEFCFSRTSRTRFRDFIDVEKYPRRILLRKLAEADRSATPGAYVIAKCLQHALKGITNPFVSRRM